MLAGLVERRRAFVEAPPPKSAGFADFGPALAADLAREFAQVPPTDRVRTAVEFTAWAFAEAFARHVRPRFPGLKTVRLSGGGTRNPTLLARLRALSAPLGLGCEPLDDALSNAKEALGFALLADATLRGRPSSLPSATGARHAVLLGKISLGGATT